MTRRTLGEIALAALTLIAINAIVLGALRWERSNRFDGAWIGTAGTMRVTLTIRTDDGHVTGYGGFTRANSNPADEGPLTITGIATNNRVALKLGSAADDYMTFQATLRAHELRGLLYVDGASVPLALQRP